MKFLSRKFLLFPRSLKDLGFHLFTKHVEYPFQKDPVHSNIDRYWEMEEKLSRIRIANDFEDSAEEHALLDEMDALWFQLTDEEQIEIHEAPLNLAKFFKNPPKF